MCVVMPKYLQKRRRRWYAVLEIPKDLRAAFGKARFVQSLETESQTVAERKLHPLVGEWKRQIELARTSDQPLEALLAELERNSEGGDVLIGPGGQRLPVSAEELRSDELALRLEAYDAFSPNPKPIPQHLRDAAGVVFSGKTILSRDVDQFIERAQGTDRTKRQKRAKINRLTERFRFAEDVTEEIFYNWVEEELIGEQKLGRNTLRGNFGEWRRYWKWLRRRHGLELANPFDEDLCAELLRLAREPLLIEPWEVHEYWHLLNGAEDDTLRALIQLAAYTGLRREAICSLRLEDVLEDRFFIRKRKYEPFSREFPIHSTIKPLVERLVGESKNGMLLPLSPGRDDDYSELIGQRFGYYKRQLGYADTKRLHSFRHTVNNQLRYSDVPDFVIDLMLGWRVQRGSTGLTTYTKAHFPSMQAAIENVSYDND